MEFRDIANKKIGNGKNPEIKKYMMQKNVKQYEVAAALGVAETTLCKWLRNELTPELEKQIKEAADRIAEGR